MAKLTGLEQKINCNDAWAFFARPKQGSGKKKKELFVGRFRRDGEYHLLGTKATRRIGGGLGSESCLPHYYNDFGIIVLPKGIRYVNNLSANDTFEVVNESSGTLSEYKFSS